ncbi:MAG: tyrosine-type recombinase/integrase [Paucibacter sp.]|nr:tyrosine-type recombinase/integrase [Roseateles sp.]
MTIKKSNAGWLVDVQPGGRGGKRFRKTFRTQAEAKAYEAWLTTQVNQNAKWQPEKRDTRRLAELIDLWHTHHGVGLRAGANTYSRLKLACEAMGNPVADRFTVNTFADYRTRRLAAGIAPNSVNREHAYLRSVFNELRRLGQWKRENPLANLRQFKVQERELEFLTLGQCRTLLAELANGRNRHAPLIAKVCLATGARWSEAELLEQKHVKNGQIQYAGTKSGKVRVVPIPEALADELKRHHQPSETGARFFGNAYSAFRDGVGRTDLSLPDGQMTHILRHTFASHFMMNGGNILTLQKILGHANLTMTMRYAHLAPEHLQEARVLNPLVHLQKADNRAEPAVANFVAAT